MRPLLQSWDRLRSRLRPPPALAREVDAEFDFHLQSRIEDFLASGLSLREARNEALRRFGPSDEFRRECLAAWHSPDPPAKGDSSMKNFLHDLRYALRMLRRSPGFTVVALLTLALAIGANTAIFSVVNGVLLRPLPYPEPERLTVLWERAPNIETMSINYLNYRDWRTQNTVFDELAIFRRSSYNLTGAGEAVRIPAAQVSANLFNTVAVQPALGRAFTPEEDDPGTAGVVILSHGLWENRFGANPNILGTSLTLNGRPHTVIGVMPRTYAYPSRVQLWVPIGPVFAATPGWNNRGVHPGIFGIARIKRGISFAQAQANMDTIAAALAKQFRAGNANASTIVLTSLRELLVRDVRPALWVLFGAVLFVLLIACANLANLQLSRAAARHRELAIRTALGAVRSGLIRLLLAESLLLSFVGGALGYLLGRWGLDALLTAVPNSLPAAAATGMDHWVLVFTLGVSVFTGVLFGLAPALNFSRADVSEDLKEGGRGASGNRTHRLRALLVVSEVALAMILLVGAGLLTQSFLRLSAVNPGFDPDGVLTAQVSLPAARYPARPDSIRFFDHILSRIQALPGVASAAMTDNLPFAGGSQTSFGISGRPLPRPGEDRPLAEYFDVSPDYFRAMSISLLRGRTFTEADGRSTTRVVIIDEALARKHFPNQDPIGQHLLDDAQDIPANRIEIIGVVSTVRVAGLATEARFVQMYFPYTQSNPSYGAIVLRTSGDPASLAPALRAAIQSLDKDLPVYAVLPMAELVDSSIANWRLNMLLISIFSSVAVVLAAVGIYGVMSYQVAQRTQEIGIRMALGAQQSSILRLMVSRGALLAGAGLAIGVAGAFGLTRFLTNMLFNIKPTDALTYVSVAVLLAFIALLACFLPARRAAKLDPLAALRYE